MSNRNDRSKFERTFSTTFIPEHAASELISHFGHSIGKTFNEGTLVLVRGNKSDRFE